MAKHPFEGVRVLNFGTAAVAPMAARYFAEYGAEVIKIETMTRLDMMRLASGSFGPLLAPEDSLEAGVVFLEYNRGVKSVQANLKKPKTIDLMRDLVKVSDVVIENFSPRVMKGLGLSYEDLKEVKSDIIMLSLSAVGQTGPMKDIKTYGPTIAALCSKQSMMGYQDGEPAHDYASPDFNGAAQAAFLTMAALRYRNKTGEGQYIDLGQAAPSLYIFGEPLMDLVMNNVDTSMQGNWRRGFAPNNMYRCKPDPLTDGVPEDQWVSISVETDEEWKSMCEAMGAPAWGQDEKFADYSGRWENQAELDELIGRWTINYSAHDVAYKLQQAGVAAMPAMTEEYRAYDPHLRSREVFRYIDTAKVPHVVEQTEALGLSDTPGVWKRLSTLGEDNEYVYGELLGLSKEEIDDLKKEQVIF